MSVAILGAGPLGATLAHTLAARERVREVRLIDAGGDPEGRIAEGKALDIRQSGPVENSSTRVTAAAHLASAAGASVVVIADEASGKGEHTGETGLALVRQLVALGMTSPLVFAGAGQRELMARVIAELHVPEARVVGSAPLALESALRALVGVAVDGSGVEVSLRVVGVPPKQAVVAWEEATAFGQPIASQLPAHEIAAISSRIPSLWPPGPYGLGSAAARVVEALAMGSRRRYTCFVSLGRGRVAAMPVELDRRGVRRILEPSLTRQERTMLENAIS
jgi:malate dehydrogenase